MRICVLQSSYENSGQILQDTKPSRPGNFTDRHTFEERWIKKATAREQIDAAVGEGFDLFFNMMWGQHEDNVAGIDAIKYLESLGVPFMGLPSRIQERSKLDFYRDAAAAAVRVPELNPERFPVIVTPAKCYARMYMEEKSVCWNAEELEARVAFLNEKLKPGRDIVARGKMLNGTGGAAHNEEDIVVQDFIDGRDYSVIILEMMDTPIPMTPTRYRVPAAELKFHPDIQEELLEREENPQLFDKLQDMAMKMWHANKMEGVNWGNMGIRVRHSDGELFGIEVNPMPAVLLSKVPFADIDVVLENFPGGQAAFIDVLIESTLWRHASTRPKIADRASLIAKTYNRFASVYTPSLTEDDHFVSGIKAYTGMIKAYDLSGTVLDVAAGAGLFPTLWHKHQATLDQSLSKPKTAFQGIDISPEMLKHAEFNGAPLYEKVYVGLMQQVLPTLTEQYDHVIALSALYFLTPTQFSLTLARMFQVAIRSVMFSLEDVPEEYNQSLRDRGEPYMAGYTHKMFFETFVTPKGWKRVECPYDFYWISAHTQKKVAAKMYRYEAV